jgi:hypothetical protein
MFFTYPISNYQEKQSLPRNHPEEEVFTCNVIYPFISSVRFQLEDVDGGHLQEETSVFDAWYWDIFVRLY